ncbi:hypothetical protein Tco_0992091 [Tanacetum coccineum]|uniref:Xylulose kinase-1 n=1 Tax=Tanacetum coccineum TaxID=301880 RepID=A0ABQ5F2L7_9ASTR
MTTLQFADTHNLVAFLSKPAESEGFEQIVDFLNANPIRYALTINPTIYTSCIEQFWATVKVKTVNGEVQLQALVDGKKIIVTEASVRRDLQLNDEEGMDCLPNATIFEELTRMGAKTTIWNEFSSTMAFAIICLATNQKFNFSKYIFESMVKNLENVSGKFLMYPIFVQVFLEKQLEGMSYHKRIYVTPSHTKKIFENMRRVGKGFSGRETPLFPTMMKQKPRKPKRKDTKVPQPNGPTDNVVDEAVYKEMYDTSLRSGTRLQETMWDTIAQPGFENVSKLSNDPLLTRGNTLRSGEDSVKRLEKKGGLRTHGLKRLYKVSLSRRVESSDEEGLGEEDASKQGRIDDIDANEDIYLVNVHRDEDMFGVNDLEGDEVIVKTEVASKDVNLSANEVTLAQALSALKSAKPKADKVMLHKPEQSTITTTTAATTVTAASRGPKANGLVIHEEEQATTPTVSSQQPSQVKVHDKGIGIMVEEPEKPMKKKELIRLDEEIALKLQAKFDEEVILAREKAEKRRIQHCFKG